ncbi:DUF2066 domain-containing protein [Rhodospirillum sp. A1_3_36]|uniref:DUF2066 domain-containing protein n=1 Tax=Rhodospirillum sp. A1_3_36 TaxID=3391666 RepID=UPI0039A723BD
MPWFRIGPPKCRPRRFGLLRFGLLLGLVLAPVLAAVPASARDVYTAPPVSVDATADSPTLAKDKAIQEGQTKALRALLESMTSPADQGRLPQVSAADAQALVTDFGLADERTAAKRYLATLTVSFNAEGVDRLLGSMGVQHIAPREAPVLILPLYQSGASDSPQLWEETNPWAQAWKAAEGLSEGMVPVVLPLGDLEDIATLDAQGALAGDLSAAANLSGRYGAPDVLIVQAVGTEETGLTVLTKGAGIFAGLPPVTLPPGADIFAKAIDGVREGLDQAWKREALGGGQGYGASGYGAAPTAAAPGWGYGEQPVGAGGPSAYGAVGGAGSGYGAPAGGVVMLARFGSLSEWVDMRRKLQGIPGLQGLNLQAVTRSQAQLQLAYPGSVEDLQRIMLGRGLRMENAGSFWTLERLAGTPDSGIPGMGGDVSGSGGGASSPGFPEDPAHRRIQGVN